MSKIASKAPDAYMRGRMEHKPFGRVRDFDRTSGRKRGPVAGHVQSWNA